MLLYLESLTRYGLPAALAAFALGGAIFWWTRRNGEVPPAAWAVIALSGILGIAALAGYVRDFTGYHIVVTVLGPDGRPADAARVWTMAGSASKKVAGGWDLDVPASARSASGTLLVWAATDPNDTKHSQLVTLGADHNPAVTIRLGGEPEEDIQGRVVDDQNRGVVGAWVSIAEREDESVKTDDSGEFILPAHAARGTNVLVHISAGKGYNLTLRWVTAGDHALTLVIDKK